MNSGVKGAGREIDIVHEWADGSVATIDGKSDSTPRARDFDVMRLLRDRVGARFVHGVVLHTGSRTLPFGDRLSAVPLFGPWAEP